MTHESSLHDNNCFLTLTYTEKDLPLNFSIDKREIQLFIKRLRRQNAEKIRYFACGEYGDDKDHTFRNKYGGNLGRPHYHAIIFNYWPPDAEKYKDCDGYTLSKSEKLNQIWGKGEVFVGTVTFDSAQYVAKYITKKIGKTSVTDDYGNVILTDAKQKAHYGIKEKEFSLMSRKPFIGYQWLNQFWEETWRDDYLIINEKKSKPPTAYYRKLKELANRDPEIALKLFKIKSKRMELNQKNRLLDEYAEFARNQQKNKFVESVFKLFTRSKL